MASQLSPHTQVSLTNCTKHHIIQSHINPRGTENIRNIWKLSLKMQYMQTMTLLLQKQGGRCQGGKPGTGIVY